MNISKLVSGAITTALVALVAVDVGTAAAAPYHAMAAAIEITPDIVAGPTYSPAASGRTELGTTSHKAGVQRKTVVPAPKDFNAGIPPTVAKAKGDPKPIKTQEPISVNAATSGRSDPPRSTMPAWSSRLSGLPQGGAGLYS